MVAFESADVVFAVVAEYVDAAQPWNGGGAIDRAAVVGTYGVLVEIQDDKFLILA